MCGEIVWDDSDWITLDGRVVCVAGGEHGLAQSQESVGE
jgi:hypothetical protein